MCGIETVMESNNIGEKDNYFTGTSKIPRISKFQRCNIKIKALSQ